MKLTFSLSNDDFLTYYLYASSKSERTRKQRRNMRWLIPIAYGGFGLFVFVMYQNVIGLGLFLFAALLWFLLYPVYSKHRYRNHFANHVKDNCKNRVNIPIEFELTEDEITLKDAGSASKFNLAELISMTELRDQILLNLKSGVSLIVPKSAIGDLSQFKAAFAKHELAYSDEKAWMFK